MSFFEVESNGQITSGDRLWVEFDLTAYRSLEDVVFEFQTLAADGVTLVINSVPQQTLVGPVGSTLRFDPVTLERSVSVVRFEFASPRDFLWRQATPPQTEGYVSVGGYRHSQNTATNNAYMLPFAMEYTAVELSYVPINQDKYVGAYVVDGTLDGWFLNHAWPVAETPLSKWLMDQVGYIKPPQPTPGLPRPEYGQGWPIWAAGVTP